jgi:CubicO group peptidase (beta-lactamase class C family)
MRTLVLLAVLGALILALAGCGGQTFGAIRRDQAPGPRLARAAPTSAIVYVSERGRVSVRTSGTPRASATQRFRIGSVTKTFTATIVLISARLLPAAHTASSSREPADQT